jgi:hypothetical protein
MRLNVEIDDSVYRRLREYCTRHRTTISRVVRSLLVGELGREAALRLGLPEEPWREGEGEDAQG